MLRVTVKFKAISRMIHKAAAAIQKIMGVSTDAVLFCQSFGAEFSVLLGLIQCDDSFFPTSEHRAAVAQFMLDFGLRQNKSGGRFLALRSVNGLNLFGFGGNVGIEET